LIAVITSIFASCILPLASQFSPSSVAEDQVPVYPIPALPPALARLVISRNSSRLVSFPQSLIS
jgi:hypothetical protein